MQCECLASGGSSTDGPPPLCRDGPIIVAMHVLVAIGSSESSSCAFSAIQLVIEDFLSLVSLSKAYERTVIDESAEVLLHRWVTAFAPDELLSSIRVEGLDGNSGYYKLSNWNKQVQGIIVLVWMHSGELHNKMMRLHFHGQR